jgi:membrane protein YqaA with SNARE-associated domain
MIALGVLGVWLWYQYKIEHPYLTIFFYSVPSNAGISLFPHEPLLVWYGKYIDLWMMALVATAGTVVAAFLDYMFFAPVLNLEYSAKFKSTETYQKAHKWFYKFPFWSIVIAGFTPIPFYPFKFMVYASKYPLWHYLVAVVIGRLPRYYLLGKAGQFFQIPDWLIIGAFVAMFLIVYYSKIINWVRRKFRRQASPGIEKPNGTGE